MHIYLYRQESQNTKLRWNIFTFTEQYTILTCTYPMQNPTIPRNIPIGKTLLYPQHYITAGSAHTHIQHTNFMLTVARVCQTFASSTIVDGSNEHYVPINYTCISRNNSFAYQMWQFNMILLKSLPIHITVRTVRMQFTLLYALYEAYLGKILWALCATVHIIPYILPISTTTFTHCT